VPWSPRSARVFVDGRHCAVLTRRMGPRRYSERIATVPVRNRKLRPPPYNPTAPRGRGPSRASRTGRARPGPPSERCAARAATDATGAAPSAELWQPEPLR
jgi:hypothetical protein